MSFHIPSIEPGSLTITDGGLETDLIFNAGLELPLFASFPLLDDPVGRDALTGYYQRAIATAERAGLPFSLDTATWRSNPDWAARLDYVGGAFERINRDAVLFALALREAAIADGVSIPITIAGVIGPRDDGYSPSSEMAPEEARAYHAPQIAALASAGVDYLSAMTMTTVGEAAGIALAAREAGAPVAVSFTVEIDGRLPTGQTLREAVEAVDSATDAYPSFFGINCAHPSHLPTDLDRPWAARVASFRANASRLSHAELDEAEVLDPGDPEALAAEIAELRARHPHLTVLGGCCGTDDRHLRSLVTAVSVGG